MKKEFLKGNLVKVIDKKDDRFEQIGIVRENNGIFYRNPIEVEFPFPYGGILRYRKKSLEFYSGDDMSIKIGCSEYQPPRILTHKELRNINNYINLGEIKYKKDGDDCWRCERTGVSYSDNVMNIITEDFEEKYKELISYEL